MIKRILLFSMNHSAFTGGVMLVILIAFYLFLTLFSPFMWSINLVLLFVFSLLFARKYRQVHNGGTFNFFEAFLTLFFLTLFSILIFTFGNMMLFTFDDALFIDLLKKMEGGIISQEGDVIQKSENLQFINKITPSKIALLVFISFSIFGVIFSLLFSFFLMKKTNR